MNWIKLTIDNEQETPIYVNMDNATDVMRCIGNESRTVICFAGSYGEGNTYVKESPEYIIDEVSNKL